MKFILTKTKVDYCAFKISIRAVRDDGASIECGMEQIDNHGTPEQRAAAWEFYEKGDEGEKAI
jgi:hypothetical protein